MKLSTKQEANKAKILKAQWTNHTKGNNQFMKPGARTCRDAFGDEAYAADLEYVNNLWDMAILLVAILALVFVVVIFPIL